MTTFNGVLYILLVFIICVSGSNLKYYGDHGNENATEASVVCLQKCGKDPTILCTGDLTSDENIICGCRDKTDVYVPESKQCIDRCSFKCGTSPGVTCEGTQFSDETTTCSCTDKTHTYYEGNCKERCWVKCGEGADITCNGDHTSDETTICGCTDDTKFFSHWSTCYSTCPYKCGRSEKIVCSGNLTSYDATICGCSEDYVYDEKSQTCKDRCNIKCGEAIFVKCKGDQKTYGTTICGCSTENRVFDEEGLICIKRCVKKCGCDPNIECGGDQMTDETTICGCKDPNKVYDEETQRCEALDSCTPNPCKNEGTCTREEDKARCTCKHGFTGYFCEALNPCIPNPCKNDGTCTRVGNKAKCSCKLGFTGIMCEGPCTPNPCKNGGMCMLEGDKAKCSCKPEFTGYFCEELNPCNPNPCKKGGTCKIEEDKAKCSCRPGFTGELCEELDPCTPNPCKNEGKCTAEEYKEKCTCKPGFTGYLCEEFDPCTPNPCRNEGMCTIEEDKTRCICKPGFTGNFCDTVDHCAFNPCSNGGKCKNAKHAFECTCIGHYGGKDCSENIWCDKYGKELCGKVMCQYDEYDDKGYCVCEKDEVFDEELKESIVDHCASDPCRNGGNCKNARHTFECTCFGHYGGKDCSENIWCDKYGKDLCGKEMCQYDEYNEKDYCVCEKDEIFDEELKECIVDHCASDPCRNGGICISARHTFECKCTEHYEGKDCSKSIWCNKYGKELCGKEICQYDEYNNKGYCVCEKDEIFNDESKECIVNHCVSNPCRNGGICRNARYTFECKCTEYYEGKDCSENIWCYKYGKELCGKAICIHDEKSDKGHCICEKDEVFDEDLKTCMVDHCASDPCHNGGICRNAGYTFECMCFGHYGGKNCSENIWCNKYGKELCGKEICIYDEKEDKGYCVCKKDYVFDEDLKTCIVDHCASDPCWNGGICRSTRYTFECKCSGHYGGRDCSVNIWCNKHGKKLCGKAICVYDEYKDRGYCVCDNYTIFNEDLKTCMVDFCASDPCKNGGTCINGEDTFECICPRYYEGKVCSKSIWCDLYGEDLCGKEKCQYNEILKRGQCICDKGKVFNKTSRTCLGGACVHYSCQNGGICSEDDGGIPRCYCRIPFSGEMCEKGPCTNNPCKNGGTCKIYENTYKCICREEYFGKICEIDYRFLSAPVLILIALTALILSLITCIGCCLLKMNQRLKIVFQNPESLKSSSGVP